MTPPLTLRELEVLALHRAGGSRRSIAATLGISEAAVRTYLDRALFKIHQEDTL